MKSIDEAIKLLQKDIDDPGSVDISDLNEAQELGIEALKRINNPLQYNLSNPRVLLPGETR